MVQFLSINFFSWISSIFVGFFKSSRFLCHLYFVSQEDVWIKDYSREQQHNPHAILTGVWSQNAVAFSKSIHFSHIRLQFHHKTQSLGSIICFGYYIKCKWNFITKQILEKLPHLAEHWSTDVGTPVSNYFGYPDRNFSIAFYASPGKCTTTGYMKIRRILLL